MPDLERLAELIGRPSAPGNIGEFVAAKIFAIQLATSGSHPGHDGVFTARSLAGKTVNIADAIQCQHPPNAPSKGRCRCVLSWNRTGSSVLPTRSVGSLSRRTTSLRTTWLE